MKSYTLICKNIPTVTTPSYSGTSRILQTNTPGTYYIFPSNTGWNTIELVGGGGGGATQGNAYSPGDSGGYITCQVYLIENVPYTIVVGRAGSAGYNVKTGYYAGGRCGGYSYIIKGYVNPTNLGLNESNAYDKGVLVVARGGRNKGSCNVINSSLVKNATIRNGTDGSGRTASRYNGTHGSGYGAGGDADYSSASAGKAGFVYISYKQGSYESRTYKKQLLAYINNKYYLGVRNG